MLYRNITDINLNHSPDSLLIRHALAGFGCRHMLDWCARGLLMRTKSWSNPRMVYVMDNAADWSNITGSVDRRRRIPFIFYRVQEIQSCSARYIKYGESYTNLHYHDETSTLRKLGLRPDHRPRTKLSNWSNATQDSVTTLPISHLKSFQEHILKKRLSAILNKHRPDCSASIQWNGVSDDREAVLLMLTHFIL